jgi:hypothetical protein
MNEIELMKKEYEESRQKDSIEAKLDNLLENGRITLDASSLHYFTDLIYNIN